MGGRQGKCWRLLESHRGFVADWSRTFEGRRYHGCALFDTSGASALERRSLSECGQREQAPRNLANTHELCFDMIELSVCAELGNG